MAKTYDQLQAQIHKLQQAADALKAKEVAGVVARIRAAIAQLGLTPTDLFGPQPTVGKRMATGTPASKRGAKATSAGSTAKTAKARKPEKPAAPAKFQDDAGNQWSGIGKRPNWFKAALAAGKSADDLRVKSLA